MDMKLIFFSRLKNGLCAKCVFDTDDGLRKLRKMFTRVKHFVQILSMVFRSKGQERMHIVEISSFIKHSENLENILYIVLRYINNI